MSKLTTIALTLALTPAAGCSIFQISFGDRSNPPGAGHGDVYAGAECEAVGPQDSNQTRETEDGSYEKVKVLTSPQAPPDAPLATHAAHVVCGDRVNEYPAKGRLGVTAVLHDRFNAYDFDHATAAVIVANCARTDDCLLHATPAEASQHQRWVAGLLSFYAEHVDREKVRAALSDAGVSQGLATAFGSRVDEGIAKIKAVAAEIPEAERHAFVEIPSQVRVESEAYFREYNNQWRKLYELRRKGERERAEGVGDETIGELEALRADYVEACGAKPSCMHDGLTAEIAHELFLAHVSRGDAAAAGAEADFVEANETGRPAAQLIDERQRKYLHEAERGWAQVTSAQRRGLDADTAAAAAAGGPAHDFSNTYPWKLAEAPRVDYRAVIPGRLSQAGGKLDKKKDNGDGTVTLAFADEVTRWPQMSCRDTNKIERVHADGRIDYAQRCRKTGKVRTDRRTFDPVVVAVGEAKPLRRGDQVTLWVVPGETKHGRVRWAKRDERAVVLRTVRVKDEKPNK